MTWLVHTCDMTYPHICKEGLGLCALLFFALTCYFTRVTWRIHLCVYRGWDLGTLLSFSITGPLDWRTWLIHTYHITRPHVCKQGLGMKQSAVSCCHVLFHMGDMNHSYLHDLFICVAWCVHQYVNRGWDLGTLLFLSVTCPFLLAGLLFLSLALQNPDGYIYVRMYIYMYIYKYIHKYMYVYVYILCHVPFLARWSTVCVSSFPESWWVHARVYMYIRICVCTNLHTQMYICIYVYVYICKFSFTCPFLLAGLLFVSLALQNPDGCIFVCMFIYIYRSARPNQSCIFPSR